MIRCAVWIPIVMALAWSSTAEAGSVFLKNGYIIQGKVVERNDDGVVLGWANGQMTIPRRFIDDVILESYEEEELARTLESETASNPLERVPVVETHVRILPENLEDIMPTLGRGLDPTPVSVNNLQNGSSKSGEGTEVSVQDPPVELPPELEFSDAGVAFMPPAGWILQEQDGQIRLQKSEEQPHPSFTISYQNGADVGIDQARAELVAALGDEFEGVSLLGEREETIGFERAFVVEGDYPDRSLFFSQVLVRHNDTTYLIGLQLPTPVDVEQQKMLEHCLHSVRFLP